MTTHLSSLLAVSNAKRIFFFLVVDAVLSLVTLYLAYLLRFNFTIPSSFLTHFSTVAMVLVSLKIAFLYYFKNYSIVWRFYGLNETKSLIVALVLAYVFFALAVVSFPILFAPFPRSVIVIDFSLALIALGGFRFAKRLTLHAHTNPISLKPTLLIGISSNTANIIKTSQDGESEYHLVGIVAVQSKNSNMIGSYINGLKISSLKDLETLIKKHAIGCAIIDGSLPREELQNVYQLLSESNISDIKRSSFLSEQTKAILSLSIEDLLARHPKDLNTQTIQTFIHNKTVLITGAGGSIGSEIALQCHRFGAKNLILIDHSEYNLYQIGEKLPLAILRLCNILDRDILDSIVSACMPDIVIHAAAYKHVPLCEANIHAAIANNISGSCNVIDSAIKHNVAKIVIISTDKAVRPTNIMGTTKRIVELYAQNVDPKNSEIVAVRFGNVLGSSGSVIPKFKEQIDAGGPITLTHPDITRYFMLISEACQLVLQAAAIARGGELFILDMGEPIKIIDLARTMIRLYATKEIDIRITGLRAGEKLYEELLIDDSEQKTAFESIMIAGSTHYPIDELRNDIAKIFTSDNPTKQLKHIVPEFTHPLA